MTELNTQSHTVSSVDYYLTLLVILWLVGLLVTPGNLFLKENVSGLLYLLIGKVKSHTRLFSNCNVLILCIND